MKCKECKFSKMVSATSVFCFIMGRFIRMDTETTQEKIEKMLKKTEDILNAGKSNTMTLDEAIKHCLDRATQDCSACADEHRQLAEWLQELKQLRIKKGQ